MLIIFVPVLLPRFSYMLFFKRGNTVHQCYNLCIRVLN